MEQNELTFNDLPQVVAQLRDEVMGMRRLLIKQQEENRKHQARENRRTKQGQSRASSNYALREGGRPKVNRHKPMTVEEAAEYTRIPLGTLYMKLGDGTIPATKPGKRYVLYQDELDKWLEANRKNAVPLTADEENEAILSSHKRNQISPAGMINR
ncbi:MAG: helix-turn-helix domain-containing protein [Prevotella sp.]|nr:helix-turn-helix domain-containing protein [Prevotella sp.]